MKDYSKPGHEVRMMNRITMKINGVTRGFLLVEPILINADDDPMAVAFYHLVTTYLKEENVDTLPS